MQKWKNYSESGKPRTTALSTQLDTRGERQGADIFQALTLCQARPWELNRHKRISLLISGIGRSRGALGFLVIVLGQSLHVTSVCPGVGARQPWRVPLFVSVAAVYPLKRRWSLLILEASVTSGLLWGPLPWMPENSEVPPSASKGGVKDMAC